MSSWDGYLALGGTELANEERLRTYFANLWPGGPVRKRELEPVAGLHLALGDAPYADPASDMAPWVDLDDARTEEFLGFRVQEIIGLDDAMDQAEVVESLGYGATIGLSRVASREIRIKGVLHGLSPEGVQVGLTWLRRTLWREWAARLLVPQQPGVSDLRFFIQRPDLPAQIVNHVSNPDASGLGESLVGTAGTARAFRVPISSVDDWGYRIMARTADRAEAQLQPLERARATPGQQWVARARIWRDAAVLGARVVNLLLRFRDQYGNVISAAGPDDTQVADGVLYRWTGARFDSTSQMLTPLGMRTNYVVNPEGSGVLMGLVPYAGRPARATLVGAGRARNYRVTTNSADVASIATTSGPARAGEQWWGRCRITQRGVVGARHYRADLAFFDTAGKELPSVQGGQLDLVPSGTTRRWSGAKGNSVSEEITGDIRRYNRNPNPIPRKVLTGYTAAGGGTSVALERFTGLGTPYAIRVTTNPDGAGTAKGLNIPSLAEVGERIYVTFWILGGQSTMRLQGDGFTFVNSPGTTAGAGLPFANTGTGTVPMRVSIPITITKPTQIIRVIAHTPGTATTFRISRIGLLTGSDVYFDGDTGTFEWEGAVDNSSAIAHLPGNYDLFNAPWNGGFNATSVRWAAGGGSNTVAWDRATKRLGITTRAAVASGYVLAQQDQWPGFVGGQRVQAAMMVYNNTAAAISVAVRVTPSGGTNADSATVSIPANSSAWVSGLFGMPKSTSSASIRLVAKGAIASGASIQIDNVFMGSIPDDSAVTAAQWFDGSTPSTNGATAVAGTFDLSVGGVAPELARSARLVINRLAQGATAATDQFDLDLVMLTQAGGVDDDVSDGGAATDTLPDYFDGDSPSTFALIARYSVDTDPGASSADTTRYDAVVTAEAPLGAVSAELAIERTTDGAPSAADVLYVDDLMLASYDDGDPAPAYTSLTRRDFIADSQRWLQEVGPIAGPTVISQQTFGQDGCNGATAEVEFTLVAQRAEHLYDRGDRVRIPLPQTTSATPGVGAFAKIEDTAGVLRNYMPQFDPNSPVIPSKWTSSATAGSITTAGTRPNDTAPYVLRVTQGNTSSTFTSQISATDVLGTSGGYEFGYASVHLGCSVAGRQAKITVLAYKGGTQVATATTTVSVPTSTNGDIVQPANRFDIALPTAGAGGAANGFIIRVESVGTGWGTVYIGMPQVTLTSAAQGVIYGGLPDDGVYTYDFDGVGYSRRTPTAQPESHTIFPNRAAPPAPRASLAGYDEVGQSVYRTFLDVDSGSTPRNAVAVPVVRLDFERFLSRWVRFRFYPNPLNVAPELIPSGSFEYEWVLDQFAGNIRNAATAAGFMSVVIDGVARKVWVRAWDGSVIPGDQYVVTSSGSPISWPEFRDIPWVVSVDYPTFRQTSGTPSTESWWRASMALVIKE